jgi:hypothetical protein
VFEHFWSLALRLNNEHLNCLKAIHSDNETKFRNASFDEFCLEHGIDLQFSIPHVHFGRKPSVSHLRPFRCKCFVLKRGNLDKF